MKISHAFPNPSKQKFGNLIFTHKQIPIYFYIGLLNAILKSNSIGNTLIIFYKLFLSENFNHSPPTGAIMKAEGSNFTVVDVLLERETV